MKPETRAKLSIINKEVPALVRQKALEKILQIKDPLAVYVAVAEIILVFGLAIAFAIFIDPQINLISEQKMPNLEKIVIFFIFAAITILLFSYNKKFFLQKQDAPWVWRWKKK